MTQQIDRLPLFSATTEVNTSGHLTIGGCDTIALASEFGTPLYIFDENSLRSKCAEFKSEFGQRYAASYREFGQHYAAAYFKLAQP